MRTWLGVPAPYAVERMDGDLHLGRPSPIRMRAQLVADHLFPSAHGGFDPGSFRVTRRCLPSHAAVLGDVRRTSRFDVLEGGQKAQRRENVQ